MDVDRDAALETVLIDGVFPDDFHPTTNFPTEVRVAGTWIPVARPEMDVAIRVLDGKAESCPMHRARKGDAIVVGDAGVRVVMPDEDRPEGETRGPHEDAFRFMRSNVSAERPKAKLVAAVARAMRDAHARGEKVLLVGGPAIVHGGAGPKLEALIHAGAFDLVFAGNALAAHDIEAAMFGTSLGVDLETGVPVHHGHRHHLRAINRVRAHGSIAAAVNAGVIPRGIFHACVTDGVPFVLAGSIRDDGPLPDVITDVVAAQDAMRAALEGVTVAVLVATLLHSVAVGNMLPASVQTFAVDASSDAVIKLVDRGTHQASGIVTDATYFLGELLATL